MSQKNILSIILATAPFSYILGTFALNLNILLIIFGALRVFLNGKRFKIIQIDIIIFLFFFYILFSGIFNTYEIYYIENSLNKDFTILNKSLFFLRYLLLYTSIRLLFSNDLINFNIIFYFYSIATILISTDIILQFYSGTNLIGLQSPIPHKITSFFYDEAIAGGFLQRYSLFLFFLLVITKFLEKNILKLFVLVLFFILIITAIIFSGNRMPFLLFVFSILLIFLTNQTLKKNFVIISIFIIFVSFIVMSFSTKLKHHYLTFYDETSKIVSLYSYRIFGTGSDLVETKRPFYIHEFDAGIETFKLNKYIGGGVKSFRYNCPKRIIKSVHSRTTCNMHPHNYYLEILVDLGIFGFLIFSYIGLLVIFKTFKILRSWKYKYTFSPFYYVFLMEIFPLKSSGSFFTTNNSFIIFLCLGFLVSFYWRSHGESTIR